MAEGRTQQPIRKLPARRAVKGRTGEQSAHQSFTEEDALLQDFRKRTREDFRLNLSVVVSPRRQVFENRMENEVVGILVRVTTVKIPLVATIVIPLVAKMAAV